MKTDTLTIQQKRDASAAVPVTLRAAIAAQVARLNDQGVFLASDIASDPVVSELIYALELLAAPQARAA